MLQVPPLRQRLARLLALDHDVGDGDGAAHADHPRVDDDVFASRGRRQVVDGNVQTHAALGRDGEDGRGADDVDERRGASAVQGAVAVGLLPGDGHAASDAPRGGGEDGQAPEGEVVETRGGVGFFFSVFLLVGSFAVDEGLGEDARGLGGAHIATRVFGPAWTRFWGGQ